MSTIIKVYEGTTRTITVQPSQGQRTIQVIKQGPQGAQGAGVPDGGTTNQVLAKSSDGDQDTTWITIPGAGNVPAGDVSVENSGFEVLMGNDAQTLFEQTDVALLNARSTGIRFGGDLEDQGSGVVRITAGAGQILDDTDPENPNYERIEWAQTDLDISTDAVYFIYVDINGDVLAETLVPDESDYRTKIYLWRVSIRSGAVSGTTSIPQPSQQYGPQINDIFDALGTTKNGITITPAATDLTIAHAAGAVFERGINYYNNNQEPHRLTVPAESPVTFRLVDRNGNQSADTTVLDVENWDNNGTIQAVGGNANRTTIFTWTAFAGAIPINHRIFYGQERFNNPNRALEALQTGRYNPQLPAAFSNAIILGYIIVKRTTTDLTDASDAILVTTNKFGLVGGGIATSGGNALLAANNLDDLDDLPTALTNLGLENAVESDPTGVTGADQIVNMMSLTQAEYDDIATPDASTLYIITDA